MEIERPALCSKSRRKSAQKHTKITKRLKKPGEPGFSCPKGTIKVTIFPNPFP